MTHKSQANRRQIATDNNITSKQSNKENKKDKDTFTPKAKFWSDWGWPCEPSDEAFDGWIAMRRRKKYTISKNSMKLVGKGLRDAVALGLTVDECLNMAELKSWQGFQADWMPSKYAARPNQSNQKSNWAETSKGSDMFTQTEKTITGETFDHE